MALLNDMALFVEVAKARSFRRAAKTLDMPNSTLSRRIDLLEKEIGLRLLSRPDLLRALQAHRGRGAPGA
jgi:DNA-binding transcriptional LysR family regulator